MLILVHMHLYVQVTNFAIHRNIKEYYFEIMMSGFYVMAYATMKTLRWCSLVSLL